MLRELTFDEIDEVAGGAYAAVSAEWVNGYGNAYASGFASNYFSSASITASITPTYPNHTATLFTSAAAST
jgi:hypothetical protein